jgi:hypothetical protein
LAADCLSEIARLNAQLEDGYLFITFNCTNLNAVGIIDERLRNRLD